MRLEDFESASNSKRRLSRKSDKYINNFHETFRRLRMTTRKYLVCDITFTRIRGFVGCREFLRWLSCARPFEEFVKQNEWHGDDQYVPKVLDREGQVVGQHLTRHGGKPFAQLFYSLLIQVGTSSQHALKRAAKVRGRRYTRNTKDNFVNDLIASWIWKNVLSPALLWYIYTSLLDSDRK